MSEPNPAHRQTQTPYSALNAAQNKDARASGDAPAQAAPIEPDYLAIEAGKLESLKQALYAAFEAAPKAGIPTALVDLAATYTSALRLQMTLRGLSSMPARSAKAPIFAMPRAK